MFTACDDGCRVAVGLADAQPSMVTAKLNLYRNKNRSQSNAATQPEPAAVIACR